MTVIKNDTSSLSKVCRFFTAFLPVDKKRRGGCVRCGMCCIRTDCKILEFDDNGNPHCPIRNFRPLQCRKYPRTENELFTHSTCGYRFDNEELLR
jgi:Fe-S-cluster containining protein